MTRHRRPSPPKAHWLLLSAILAVVAGLLALDAVVTGADGGEDTSPPGPATTVPAQVRGGGAVIDPRSASPVTARARDHAIALTFDDGPDPVWTPRILDALDRNDAKATFFVTGARAAQYPDLVREILARGHEIGNHTASHTDLSTASGFRADLEIRTTDLVLAGTAGVIPALVRPPYSSTPDGLDDRDWAAAQRLGADGKLVVLSDVDSQDWRRPGADAIVANATPAGNAGAVVLMHDGGGDRAQTVEALDRLIPELRSRGWTFGTVSESVGLAGTQAAAPVRARVGGWLLVFAVGAAEFTAGALFVLTVVATVLALLRTVLLGVTTSLHVRRRRPREAPDQPVTVIIPAYNEREGIEWAVRSALAAGPRVQVIVVDDGSTDGTDALVERIARRRPSVRLIRQANAGKAAALNTGLAAARTELVVLMDGDTVLEPGSVPALVRNFADPAVAAVSGNAKVGNRGRLLGRWQHIEYVCGFNLDRRLYDVLECMPTVPGAVGAFRRSAVLRVGGVPTDTLAEDTDLTMALERGGWRVVYEEEARALTEAPATLAELWKQRYRWCYGTLQSVWKHRHAVAERGSAGRLGRRGLPYLLLFQVLLPIVAPLVDVAAVFGLFTGERWLVLGAWLAFLALQAIPAVVAFRLDREPLRPLLALPLQQFVYRQLMYLVVLQSLSTALAGARLPWHKLPRRGLLKP
ncbi:bifunctional polysaccharide deacetylase/glycosyltransferase family 2 protein [Amycolatopsis thermoflava]|uniref:bifunctional polysaccharide deacetylase/glycosyltransferase family 2 protein n=1 Tax=Amycolatopsis thermoflava TaxID=84480 RepID=UPI000424F0FD|nr:bifunctional polysaccharide deacetylase/glycosyltransferase family 2 protein [Amycolatopsis thermoflava]